jgi:hypothetical protein
MRMRLHCDCGREVSVTEGAAGAALSCECGRKIQVPSLDEMQAFAREHDLMWPLPSDGDEPTFAPRPVAGRLVMGCGALVLLLGATLLFVRIWLGLAVIVIGGVIFRAGRASAGGYRQ